MPHTPPKIFFLLLLISLFPYSLDAGNRARNTASAVLGKTSAVYEQRVSTLSNHEFFSTNYGVIGQNTGDVGYGWFWPRQSKRWYIFGQSIWFGAKKKLGQDTVGVVSVGYNPDSGVSWFGPGSIDDGPDVLPETDPRSAKYYMYVATDFSAEGKNLKDPSLPDWPIRWVNQSKTPGIHGYFGDYVADPAVRANHKPVFISQEDMFCIYKDTDTKRDPEYKPGTGYPIGLDILQSTYTWSYGAKKDIVCVTYTIINKSADTLRECFLTAAGDQDIGNMNNDHNAYYSKDESLNLSFQYTETEAGYPGVLGIDLLESPKVKTIQDSINLFRSIGIKRNIGEQIGASTFRNWTIDLDPPNGPNRYYFIASGQRDGDSGAGDKRFLLATGPFGMLPGDTTRIALGIMIAPGVGSWDAAPNVMNNGFLDSLVALDKFAQSFFDNAVLSVRREELPIEFSLSQNYPNPFNPSTTIRYSIDHPTRVRMKVFNILGQLVNTTVDEVQSAGVHNFVWDGTNGRGISVATGVYYYRIESGNFIQTKKMVLLK